MSGGVADSSRDIDLDELAARIAGAVEVHTGQEADWVAGLAAAFARNPDPPRLVHLEVILFGLRNRDRLGGALPTALLYGELDLQTVGTARALRFAGRPTACL